MLEAGMSPAGRIRAWLAALIAVTMISALLASSAGAVPAGFWGVVPQGSPSVDQLQRLKQGGVGSVRVPIPWSLVEPVQGAPNWAAVDPMIAGAATAGI